MTTVPILTYLLVAASALFAPLTMWFSRVDPAQSVAALLLEAAELCPSAVGVSATTDVSVEGLALADCPELIGDRIGQVVRWKKGDDLGSLRGKPVRLRFLLRDADLYAIQFDD